MKKLLVLAIGILMAIPFSLAYGAPYYNTDNDMEWIGYRLEDGGIITGGSWRTDLLTQEVQWRITQGSVYHYEYTFLNFSKPAISHVILELSGNCIGSECVNLPGAKLEFNTFGPHVSNPGFPEGASIYGVKFDFGGESPFMITFDSNRAPVWGNFYTKGGVDSYAYNEGLLDLLSDSPNCFVPRPDTKTQVPEPSTILFLGAGLIGLWAARKRTKK